jgi:hypothetical protein
MWPLATKPAFSETADAGRTDAYKHDRPADEPCYLCTRFFCRPVQNNMEFWAPFRESPSVGNATILHSVCAPTLLGGLRIGFITLDRLLARLHANKGELLMILDRPEIPMHTNGSENDVRCQHRCM